MRTSGMNPRKTSVAKGSEVFEHRFREERKRGVETSILRMRSGSVKRSANQQKAQQGARANAHVGHASC